MRMWQFFGCLLRMSTAAEAAGHVQNGYAIIRELTTPSTVIGWRAGFSRPFALHDRDHRQLLMRQAIGLHVAEHGNR